MPLIGHETIRESIASRFREGRLAHALLFTGPPGVGKFLVASEVAQMVACRETPSPCRECDRCLRVAAGSHPDVRFVAPPPGKKDIGVELARDIKHFVQMASVDSPFKVVVIDQASHLTLAAQNALLKTLEEPPGKAIIMLVTDSPGGLLATVRSRCQRLGFGRLDDDSLRAVLKDQGVDTAASDELVRRAHGSPGRALAIHTAIDREAIDRLESSIAGLRNRGYVSIVKFVDEVGRTEREMNSRLDFLEESLQHELSRSVLAGKIDADTIDRRLRAIAIIAECRRLLRRRNPNRPLLAEATALKLASL